MPSHTERRPGQLPTRELCSFARNRAIQSDCRLWKRIVRAHYPAYALPVCYYTMYRGRREKQDVHGSCRLVAAGVYEGCCYVSGYHYAKDKAIRQFILGRDVFVSLPTGYGKSVCYFSLPLVFDRLRRVEKKSVVVVVIPLVALMKDEVASPAFSNSLLRIFDIALYRKTRKLCGDLNHAVRAAELRAHI